VVERKLVGMVELVVVGGQGGGRGETWGGSDREAGEGEGGIAVPVVVLLVLVVVVVVHGREPARKSRLNPISYPISDPKYHVNTVHTAKHSPRPAILHSVEHPTNTHLLLYPALILTQLSRRRGTKRNHRSR
jgi:hypothetical protein